MMTNVPQTIPNLISAPDQNVDEVHLTELLPVDQSQFSEASSDKDANVTDGLKALRSFPHCSGEQFNAQFDFPNETSEDSKNGYLRKRKPERWKYALDQLEHEDCLDKSNSAPCKGIEGVGPTGEKVDVNQGGNETNLPNGKPKTNSRKRSRKPSKETQAQKPSRVCKSSKVKQPDKEVTETIDAIIQKNYLMERENNNVPNIQKFTYRLINPANPDSSQNGEKTDQNKKYGCVLCEARFKGTGGLRNHYKVMHGAGPLYKCNECGKEFPLKERLKLHVRTHTGFRPYKCNECDKTFARGGQLAQHRRTHSQVKPYRCTLCSGMFTCSANLSIHMKRHNGQKDHKCDICGRGFVRRDALKKHLECLHQDVKSFLCVICNKTFKGHLPQHMRTHAQDRPHGCGTCGQRFAQKSQLTVHQRTHSGQRPFRCVVCWQAFAHSTALKLHTRRHTGERPFKCVECNAGFTQLPHWKKHMRCIHGRNEPYCCKNCKSFFRIKSDLEVHEKSCFEASSQETNAEINNLKNSKYSSMSIEKMRLLLAVLLKRISKPERLEELGFGKRLIDEILEDSLIAAGKDPIKCEGPAAEYETLRSNLEIFLEWTVPQEHWKTFQKKKKTPEQILETLPET